MSKSTCCIHECGKPVYGNLLCSMHYNRMYRHGTTAKPKGKRRECRMLGCDKPVAGHGWCRPHYSKFSALKDKPGCVIQGCDRKQTAKLLCPLHYNRLRDTGTTDARPFVAQQCRMPGCADPSRNDRWCSKHWSRIQRTGSPFDKDQRWVIGDFPDCVVCGRPTGNAPGLRRYCSASCASSASKGPRLRSKECISCGATIDLMEVSETGRLKYSSAATCKTCSRTPNLRRYVPMLVERDGSDCHLCSRPVDLSLKYPDPMSRSVDHVIPRSRGGADSIENYRLSHLTCNVKRNNRMLEPA